MKIVEITPRKKFAIYGALVKREAAIRKNKRGTFLPKGPVRQSSAIWAHKKFRGTVSLKREDSQSVTAKIHSRVPEDELGLLKSFLGFLDRYCRDQVATITIHYH
jgi:hypothetical protein